MLMERQKGWLLFHPILDGEGCGQAVCKKERRAFSRCRLHPIFSPQPCDDFPADCGEAGRLFSVRREVLVKNWTVQLVTRIDRDQPTRNSPQEGFLAGYTGLVKTY